MYAMFLDGVQYPVPPSKIETKVSGNNKTVNLADGSEINLIKTPGLTDISFSVTLPGVPYPFAVYPHGFRKPKYFLDRLEALMLAKKPFQFILARELPDSTPLHYTDITVALEDYTYTDDAGQGFDTTVKISLRQFRDYMTGLGAVQEGADGTFSATPQVTRADNRAAPSTYTVKAGDTLPNIARLFLGSDGLYTALMAANGITNPVSLAVGTVIRLDV